MEFRAIWELFQRCEYQLKSKMFIYSEKATNFYEISTVGLSYVVTVKSTLEILKIFVAFSEYTYEL